MHPLRPHERARAHGAGGQAGKRRGGLRELDSAADGAAAEDEREGDELRKIDPQVSLEAMHKTGPLLAQAKAERVWLEEYRKSLKALLMKASQHSSAVMQERDAYADESYLLHLKGLREAVEKEEALRWKMVTAQAAVEGWRSQEASNRAMDRSAA